MSAQPAGYPGELDEILTLPDATRLRIRPLRPCEERPVRDLFAALSVRSRYLRFLSPFQSLPDNLVRTLACIDYRRTLSLIAERDAPDGAEVIALVNFGAVDDEHVELGLVVRDDWQGRRVGTELARRIVHAAEARGYRRFIAHIAYDNLPIRRILARVGDVVSARSSGGVSEVAFQARH